MQENHRGTRRDEATTGEVGLQRVVEGEFAPTGFATPPGDDVKYVVDQPGRVLVLEDGDFRDEPFLDIRDRVVDLKWGHDERGLIGLAFHPDYEQNRLLYVRYSAPRREGTPENWDHTEVLAEFEAAADGSRVDPATERTVMEMPHPHLHHNAGDLAFGPEGHLYLGMGDGGHTGDVGPGHVEGGNGQDVTENLLGSVVRIDVDDEPTEHPRTDPDAPDHPEGDEGYGLPGDNPWIGGRGQDELYAWGLRNPYRISFDDQGQLFVADVGEHLFEWVNVVERGGNYGWNIREGSHCFDPESQWEPPADCPGENDRGEELLDPIVEYPHIKSVTGAGEFVGSAIVGGHVYDGDTLPALEGQYVFGDLSKKYDAPRGRLFAASRGADGAGRWDHQPLGIAGVDSNLLDDYLFTIGRDQDGELYLLTSQTLNTRKKRRGAVYEIVPPEESEVTGPRYNWQDAGSDAYWYSLYNMNSMFVRSGNGIVFPLKESQFEALSQEIKAVMKGIMQRAMFMKRRHAILENSRKDELPVENPQLLVAPFTTGDPHFTEEPDTPGRNRDKRPDVSTQRWDREKSSQVVSPAAHGWTHLKGITWAKSFEHEFDLAPIATRERPQILGTAAQLGIKFAIENGHLRANPDDDEDMTLVGSYRPADDEVINERASPDDYAAMLWFLSDMLSFAQNGWFGYENPDPMIEVDEIRTMTDALAATTFAEYPAEEVLAATGTRDLGVLLGATALYGTQADSRGEQRATDYANDLADAVESNLTEEGYVERGNGHQAATQGVVGQGLAWASRLDGVDRESVAEPVLVSLVDGLWDADAGTFATARNASTYVYTPQNAGDVVGGLNAADAALGMEGVKERYAQFFDETFNRGRLQRATRWQAYRPEGEHPLPLEQDAGGEHGQAAVYNAEIAYDTEADEWRVTDDSFDTAGSLYLANQDLWMSVWGGEEFPGRGVPGESDRLPRWEDER